MKEAAPHADIDVQSRSSNIDDQVWLDTTNAGTDGELMSSLGIYLHKWPSVHLRRSTP
jgi:hypothetical protein